jgi:putative transposase
VEVARHSQFVGHLTAVYVPKLCGPTRSHLNSAARNYAAVGKMTLSQETEPFGNRTTGMMKAPRGAGVHTVRKSKFTDDQIAFGLKQAELGISVEEVCRKIGISDATFYVWRKKYGGVGPSELRRLRQLEEENRKLKQIVADLSLHKSMLQAVVSKKV